MLDRLSVLCFAGTYGLALAAELARLVVRIPVRWHLTAGLTLLGWLVLSRIGELAPGADIAATSLAWYDELRMAPVVAAGFRSAALDEAASWWVADMVRVLLALPRPSTIKGRGRTADLRLLEAWLARDIVRAAMGVNTWEGVEWLDRDRFVNLLRWAVRLDAIATGRPFSRARPITRFAGVKPFRFPCSS